MQAWEKGERKKEQGRQKEKETEEQVKNDLNQYVTVTADKLWINGDEG